MELKKYLQLIKKHKQIFFAIWLGVIFLGLFVVRIHPVYYQGEFTINIIRKTNNKLINISKIEKKEYDYYYRLEADKELVKILKQSLQDESLMKKAILDSKKNKNFSFEDDWILSKIKGKILGAGYLKIIIKAHQKQKIQAIALEIQNKLNFQLKKVSTIDNNLLKIIAQPLIIKKQQKPYLAVGLGAFCGGLLLAIFSILILFYLKDDLG